MQMYLVHSTIKTRGNPTVRRKVQFVGSQQTRLLKKRPLQITEEQLLKDLAEYTAKEKKGLLVVKTRDGRKVDLLNIKTGEPIPTEEATPTPPLAHPPLDSAANDINGGEKMSQFKGGISEVDVGPVVDDEAPIEIPAEFLSTEETQPKAADKMPEQPHQPHQRRKDRR